LTEENIQEAMKEVRIALLEADVNFKVVRISSQSVQSRAIGQEVMSSLTPAPAVIKIVKEEMTSLMAVRKGGFILPGARRFQSCWWGLHGCEKTTTAAKLARYFKEKKKTPLFDPG